MNTSADAKTVAGRKRPKRVVEHAEYDAMTRRILRAYGRRVAAGDPDALRSLSLLSAELDAVMRLAVAGLREQGFSWAEIAGQLGTSRQAAQMRFGTKTERGALDRRLTEAGMNITVSALVGVFVEHDPGTLAASRCPACGYEYAEGETDCPSRKTARPLLLRRRNEDKNALSLLSPDQYADLHGKNTTRKTGVAVQSARPAAPAHKAPDLFGLDGKDAA